MVTERFLGDLLLRALALKFIAVGIGAERRGLCYNDVCTAQTGVTSSLCTPRN